MAVGFDIRIPATVDLDEFKAQIDQWVKDAGANISYQWVAGTDAGYVVSTALRCDRSDVLILGETGP